MIVKKKQANISLIMLFVLGIGSIIGLMSTSFVQDMLNSSKQLRDFYGSYYIAKGGTEIGNLIVNRYEHGFEDFLSGTNTLFTENLSCERFCNLSLAISSRFKNNTNQVINLDNTFKRRDRIDIEDHQKFSLASGESLILPLFMDTRKISQSIVNSQQTQDIKNLLGSSQGGLSYDFTIQSPDGETPLGIGIVLGDEFQDYYDNLPSTGKQMLYTTGTLGEGLTIKEFLNNTSPLYQETSDSIVTSIRNTYNGDFNHNKKKYNYLYITNLGDKRFKFSIGLPSRSIIIGDQAIVEVLARHGKTELGLQANIKKPLLEYIVRPHSSY